MLFNGENHALEVNISHREPMRTYERHTFGFEPQASRTRCGEFSCSRRNRMRCANGACAGTRKYTCTAACRCRTRGQSPGHGTPGPAACADALDGATTIARCKRVDKRDDKRDDKRVDKPVRHQSRRQCRRLHPRRRRTRSLSTAHEFAASRSGTKG